MVFLVASNTIHEISRNRRNTETPRKVLIRCSQGFVFGFYLRKSGTDYFSEGAFWESEVLFRWKQISYEATKIKFFVSTSLSPTARGSGKRDIFRSLWEGLGEGLRHCLVSLTCSPPFGRGGLARCLAVSHLFPSLWEGRACALSCYLSLVPLPLGGVRGGLARCLVSLTCSPPFGRG